MPSAITEVPDSGKRFVDGEFARNNSHIADSWVSIRELYPEGANQPLLPDTFSRDQFGQGNHYECFMLSALATLVRFPDVIRHCFVSKKVRQDGRYTFQFFRGQEWVKVEIDDTIALEDGDVLYAVSPTQNWWPLLLEKAYAKFYTCYDHLEGCTLQETFHDLTGNPVLNIPMDAKLAKAANIEVGEGSYWLDLAQKILMGEFTAAALTKDVEVEDMGLQREQQYGILGIFSLTGTSSLTDIVIHMHNPFEDDEFAYSGPLNSGDVAWTPKLRAKYDVENPRSIFLPLNHFLKIMNSMQLCFIHTVESTATYYQDQWKGETAGGNPTSVTWRKNPLYYISNMGTEPASLSFVIKQEDQRRFNGPDDEPTYKQCGMVLSQYVYARPIPTFWVTGNNHKPIHKSLFLNSREVANAVTIPPNSLCYLVPSCMSKDDEAKFQLAVYRMVSEDYSNITIRKLDIPSMDWKHPIVEEVSLQMRTKDRIDFYVEEPTDAHILLHQLKPYVSPKTGGDAMAQDYMGMYLYDDTDRKVAGVHAATNFRETSIIFSLPRSGRYALSITCPRGKGDVPARVTIVASQSSRARQVDTPEDAMVLPDEMDEIDEDGAGSPKANRIDYDPINLPPSRVTEAPDSSTPFEDKRFMVDNHNITKDAWVHIGDLYPEGKTQPLLPDVLSREQFEQGEHFECCCLTAFAALVDRHPDVIRNCFVSKNPRRDGRYTFQFHRYGQWMKVEIDDRIPQIDGKTLYCRSPTRNWWPLLLEKAYAKFYTLYQNLEGCTQQEVLHDFTGCPVVSIPTETKLAHSASYQIDQPQFWMQLRAQLETTAIAGLSESVDRLGMNDDQSYAILDIVPVNAHPASLADIIVKLHNPYVEAHYTGPLHAKDSHWPAALKGQLHPEAQNVICMPASVFCETFLNLQQAHVKGLVEPSWHFNSEWGEGTSGGNPTLVTWRENPLYVVHNTSSTQTDILAMVRQNDRRHLLHTYPDNELSYIQCGLVLSQSQENTDTPTYLVTGNNHGMVHKGLFLNARDVANRVTIPPRSLCYLVPSAMHHEQGPFMLSYWYTNPSDARAVQIRRLQVDVARRLPAVAHVTLAPGGKDRVDFLVDCPTDAHILLAQLKTDRSSGANDAMTRDFLGMYLYDEKDNRVTGVSAATNFREIGLVAHLPKPGRYALSITCPQGEGRIPCRVEVVCSEPAHVRITDPPEDYEEFDDLEQEQIRDALVPFDNERYITEKPMDASKQSVAPHPTGTSASRGVEAVPEKTEEVVDDEAINLSFLEDEYLGIPTEDLDLLNNPAFHTKAAERQKLKKYPSANASRINALEVEMGKIAAAVAAAMHEKERVYLDKEPEGIPLPLLPLNEDPAFSKMEDQLRAANKEPAPNAKKIDDLQAKLNTRAHELAKQLKEAERDLFLDPMPLGVPVALLPLDEDSVFHPHEIDRLYERKKSPQDDAKIRELNRALNNRAEELARKRLADDRGYLAPEHFHVANSELPLDDNPNFTNLEAQRQELLAQPKPNKTAVKALEDELNNAAANMAKELLHKQRPGYLKPEYRGHAPADLPLDENDAFLLKERQRRDELRKPRPDGAVVKAIEDDLHGMADEMAKDANVADRDHFMKGSYLGVPRKELPLDTDPRIAELEAQRARLKREPSRNARAMRNIEDAINDRANELAKQKLRGDRDYLDPNPHGIPLALLPLDEDGPFRQLENERFRLLDGPASPREIAAIEDKLNERARQLAKDFKKEHRPTYTRDVPIADDLETSLSDDLPFDDMERKMYSLLAADPVDNKDQIQDLQDALFKRAAELERQRKQRDRGFLDQTPLGIPLDEIGLDDDPNFLDMEKQLRQAKRDGDDDEAERLQDEMQKRAYELAADELQRRYPFIDPAPENIPLADLPEIGGDNKYWDLAKQLDDTKRATAGRHKPQIAAIEQQMNDRLDELARAKKQRERDFLDQAPHGIPLDELDLDDHKPFTDREDERRTLKQEDPIAHADRIHALEDEMRDITDKLGEAAKWKDRESFLDPYPEGVPLREVPLDESPEFLEKEAERRRLIEEDPRKNAKKIADLEKQLNDLAHDLAKEKKRRDREEVLGGDHVDGVGLDDLGLDEDPRFAALEQERAELKRDPSTNPEQLRAVEDAMRDRANELAEAAKWKDRESFLDPYPEGVPLREVPLDESPEFLEKEAERRRLIEEDPRKNAKKIADLEKQLNDLAHDLAKEKKRRDREEVLGGDHVDGVGLDDLGLDEDPRFAALEQERAELKRDPSANPEQLRAVEDAMRDRANELAEAAKWKDRESFLDPYPEGVPLREVPLDESPEFLEKEAERRRLIEEDPRKNAKKIADLEKQLNDLAHDLAKEKKRRDREEVLGGDHVDGVGLDDLGLDEDPRFAALEQERAELKRDPSANPEQLRAVEDAMRDRANELAEAAKWKDRESFLDPYPEGVPLREVPLDESPEFLEKEAERRRLIEEDPRKNAKKIADLEKQLNDLAHDLAKEKKRRDREEVLGGDHVDGVGLDDLGLDEDPRFAALEQERAELKRDPSANPEQLRAVEDAMRDRANELAEAAKWKDRESFLDPYPEGVPLREVPLDESPEFLEKEAERRRLIEEDPRKNAKAIADLEKQLNDLAHDLAKEKKRRDREEVLGGDHVDGVGLDDLGLDEDPRFAALEQERAELKRDPSANPEQLRAVEDAMRDRANELAEAAKWKDRESFLDPYPEGVPLREVPLDESPEFLEKEAERRRLIEEDPRKNAKKIADLEKQLNDLAHDLAKEKKRRDREEVLGGDHVDGVGLDDLGLDEDPRFAALEQERAELKRDPSANPEQLRAVEDAMRDRANELAEAAKWKDRESFLDPYPEGVPLREVPLDESPEFLEKEAERRRLIEEDPRKNAKAIADLEKQLNDLAHDLAKEKKRRDREEVLGGDHVDGVGLDDLGLDEDPRFAALEQERAELKRDPSANPEQLRAVEDAMRDRANELAEAAKWKDRESFLDPYPEGVPLREVPLDESPEFLEKEAERRRLIEEDPRKNAKAIADLEKQLNDLAHDLAKEKKRRDREEVLGGDHVDGVGLDDLGLDEDPRFAALEQERAELKRDPSANPEQLRAVEDAMRDRANELAEAAKWKDRESFLDPYPEGVPLREVPLDESPEFLEKEAERRRLIEEDPRKNAKAIADLEKQLNDLAHDLAKEKKRRDREEVLGGDHVDGVGLDDLGLDEDPRFAALEQERAELKRDPSANPEQLRAVEDAMRDRANELAEAAKWKDRESFLDPYPEGVPLREVPLDESPEFLEKEAERRRLIEEDPRKNAKAIADLEKQLNDLAHDLAKEKKRRDREEVLGGDHVDGVGLDDLGLDEDPRFAELEQERAEMKRDPSANPEQLRAVEDAMRDRANELAEAAKWKDRESFLDPYPEGVPLREVPLDESPEFLEKEAERRRLIEEDPRKNAKAIADLEKQLNDLAHDLAKEKKRRDREEVLGGDHVDGVGLDDLGLDEDPRFAALEQERAELKRDPSANPEQLRAVEDAMRDRANELAEAAKWKDRESFLDPYPEGVPLREVPLDESPEFLEKEAERRRLIEEDPRKNAKAIADLEKQLNDLAHDLAKEKKRRDREEVLGGDHVDGVGLDDLGLDEDPRFAALEQERAELKRDPSANPEQLRAVEDAMRDRANELAEAAKWKDRESFLDPYPEGVPLREVPLDESPEFLEKEAERRRLIEEDPRKNAKKIADLEKQLNDLAHDLAKEKKRRDREEVLGGDHVDGVGLDDLGLDEDPRFAALEQERAEMKRDPSANPEQLRAVEDAMRDRANELAEAAKWKDRESFLDPYPEGVPLREVPLDESPEFLEKEAERRRLIEEDPRKNAKKIADLEKQLNDLAHDLAKEKKRRDREEVLGGDHVDGVGLDDLGLDEDPRFAALEQERAELKRDPSANPEQLRAVEDAMRDRANELAEAAKWKDRESFLDPYPEGVPLREVPLDESPEFLEKEAERRRLIEEDPRKNAKKIADLEKQLNDLAHDLAKEKKRRDREEVLGGDHVDGVGLDDLGLDEDPHFAALEQGRAELKRDPSTNPEQLRAVEDAMRDRANELAEAAKWKDRESFLDPYPEGVPLREVPLDESPEFLEKEAERRRLIEEDPRKNAKAIADLEKQLNDLAHDLAKEKKRRDREEVLGGDHVDGVGLDDLGLDEDPRFAELEQERAEMKRDPSANPEQLRAVEDAMRDRANELAEAAKWKDRESFLDPYPEGVPLREVPLDESPEFLEKEAERRRLIEEDPRKNAKKIADLEKQLNDLAHDLAKEKKWVDRRENLDADPEGVRLEDVGLDEDPAFRALEDEWQKLAAEDEVANAARLKDVAEAMNDRAHELAAAEKERRRRPLGKYAPKGVDFGLIPLDGDPEFLEHEGEAVELRRQDPEGNAERLADLEEKMGDRVRELGEAMLEAERAFLDQYPEGVPLAEVPLDDDSKFLKLEEERRRLIDEDPKRNAKKIAATEDAMNARSHELAKALKDDARSFLPRRPEGVPIGLVGLDDDSAFLALEQERQQRKKAADGDREAVKPLEDSMIARAEELAREHKHRERDRILGDLPWTDEALDADPEFCALEDKRYDLMLQDPVRNAGELAALEDAMRDRVRAIAAAGAEIDPFYKDRKYLDSNPEGIPIEDVPLDADGIFGNLEDELFKLLQDPKLNGPAIDDTIGRLNDRAHELAKGVQKEDLKFVQDAYNGIPADKLNLHSYPEFQQLANKNRHQHREGRPVSLTGDEINKDMDRFAQELARQLMADEYGFLPSHPEGIPLDDLNVFEDPEFNRLDGRRKELNNDPQTRHNEEVKALERQMSERVHIIAKAARPSSGPLDKDALPFLRDRYQGMPVGDIDVSNDPELDALLDQLKQVQQQRYGSPEAIDAIENAIHDHLNEKAKDQLRRERAQFLPDEVRGVPLENLPLNEDPIVNPLEHELRRARKDPAYPGEVEDLENRIRDRVGQLADEYVHNMRAYLPSEPEGVPLDRLDLDSDPVFVALEKELARLEAEDPNSAAANALRQNAIDHVHGRAKDYLHAQRPSYLPPSPGGVPLDDLNNVLDRDPVYRALEAELNRLGNDPARDQPKAEELVDRLRDRAEELGRAMADAAKPPVPAPDRRPRGSVTETEERVRKDVHEVIEPNGDAGWEDPAFPDGSDRGVEQWPRIGDLYPEGHSRPLLPENPSPADVASPPGDLTYLAPFLAALSRQPPLLLRLFNTRVHPVAAPYSFVFFDPNSNPVEVEIDDRVPCDKDGRPKFTVSPSHEWWPLLAEKAYAKFVGGYERMEDCTSHETLHDLTGRPVTHLPLEPKLAEEVPECRYREARFWRDMKDNLDRGDAYIAVSNGSVPDGIHPQCYYAVFDVFETVPGSNDPADIVVKIHNCYQDSPHYNGPLHANDPKWTARLRSVCGGASPAQEPEFLYLPQPVFLRNFSSMQRCHISCGDRLTVVGEWGEQSSGGNPKYTTFRNNPIYLVENRSGSTVKVLAELRHTAPVFYDANNVGVYHQSALALLRPENNVKFVAPLLAYNTHKFIQKGLLTDAREVCSMLELPPNSTCYLVPYTKKKGSYGKFQLSVYPQGQAVGFTTLRAIGLTHASISTEVVAHPGSGRGSRVDFYVSEPCDVHVLLHQDKITDPASVRRGNHLAEDEIMMAAYEDNTVLVASTGDASNAREHTLAFQAPRAGRYTLLIGCPAKPVTGDAPCTISVFTPQHVRSKWIPVSNTQRPNVAPRLALAPVRPQNGASTPNGIHRPAPPAGGSRRAASTDGGTPRHLPARSYSQ